MVKPHSKAIKLVIAVLVTVLFIFLSLSVLGDTLTKELGRDEHTYCTAGYMINQGKLIYRDFSYIAQMPYHPLLCAGLYKLFDTSYYLLTARLLSFVCEVIILMCIVGIYRRAFKPAIVLGYLLGVTAAGLYVLNEYVDYSTGFAWNNSAVLACVMAALWLSFDIDFERPRRRLFIIGALLTVGMFMRSTTIVVLAAFTVMLWLRSRGRIPAKIKSMLPFVSGIAVFSAWPVSVIIRSGRAFWLNAVRIPELNAEFLYPLGMVFDKFSLLVGAILSPSYLMLAVISLILLILAFTGRIRCEAREKSNAVFSVVITILFFIIAFLLPAMWRQHLAAPVPFILVSFALPLSCLYREFCTADKQNRLFRIVLYAVAAGVFVSLLYRPDRFIMRIGDIVDREQWVPVRIHRISQDIYAKASGSKLTLTLSPLYAIEGRCKIYTELSSGVFVYRVADRLNEEEIKITHTVSPSTLDKLIEKCPPSVVIAAEQMRFLDESVINQSNASGWERKVYGKNGLLVFFRPDD